MSKSKCEHHDHGRILLITPDMIADLCPTGSLAQRQPCVFHFGSFPVQGDHERFLVVVPSPTAPGVRSFESEIVFVNRPELVVWIENMIKLVRTDHDVILTTPSSPAVAWQARIMAAVMNAILVLRTMVSCGLSAQEITLFTEAEALTKFFACARDMYRAKSEIVARP